MSSEDRKKLVIEMGVIDGWSPMWAIIGIVTVAATVICAGVFAGVPSGQDGGYCSPVSES